MSSEKNPEILERLRLFYVEKLRDMAKILGDFYDTSKSGALRDEDCTVIKHLAHDLTGSGALFGYPELSDKGRQLYMMLSADTVDSAALTDALHELGGLCAECSIQSREIVPLTHQKSGT